MSTNLNAEELVAVKHVINSYGYGVDTPDYDVLGAVFTEDAISEIDFPGVYNKRLEGFPQIREHIQELHSTFSNSRHVVTNHLYTIDGEAASGQAVFTAYHWADGKLTMAVGGTYRDELVKVGGAWRISHRRGRIDWREGAEGQYDHMIAWAGSSENE